MTVFKKITDAGRYVVFAFGTDAGSAGTLARRRRGRNPWPQCPSCFHRVPELCTSAEPGGVPCGNGHRCGCCFGPHRGPRPADPAASDDQFDEWS